MDPLSQIRDRVVRSAQLAKHKLEATFLRRERDLLLLRLGEAAFHLLQSGELPLHPGMVDRLRALQTLDAKVAAEEREALAIRDEMAAPHTAA